jgi:hypothetical protein
MFNWTTTTLINELPNTLVNGEKVRIGKHLFEKRWVESIKKAPGQKEAICKAELDLAKVYEALSAKPDAIPAVARLYIYV